jgi:ABC-type transporter Mla MlaB component
LVAPNDPSTAGRHTTPSPPPGLVGFFEIEGPVARADIPALCERVRALLEGVDADRLVCDVGAILDPDAVTVDALARIQLTAGRLGRQVRLSGASPELEELLAFMGLSDVILLNGAEPVEPAERKG